MEAASMGIGHRGVGYASKIEVKTAKNECQTDI